MIYTNLLDFIDKLDLASIHFVLTASTPRAIMVSINVPGERWEVEFHEDGQVGVEVFRGSGEIADAEALTTLFERHGD